MNGVHGNIGGYDNCGLRATPTVKKMTEYKTRNICTKCHSPCELTTNNKKHGNNLKSGPCICDICNPDSRWHRIEESGLRTNGNGDKND